MRYVYKITDTESSEFYIGSKTNHKLDDPMEDPYMGSSTYWKRNEPGEREKEILKRGFDTEEEKFKYEFELIDKHFKNPKNVNLSNPKRGFFPKLRGEECSQAKLAAEEVMTIKYCFDKSQSELAKKYKVSRSVIRQIQIGLIWAHIIDDSKEGYRLRELEKRKEQKFNNKQIKSIKYDFTSSINQLAEKYNASETCIRSIQAGKTYTDVVIESKESARKDHLKSQKQGMKLTPDEILEIKYDFTTSRKDLADKFNVTSANISIIQRNITHRELILPELEEERKSRLSKESRGGANNTTLTEQQAKQIKYCEEDLSTKELAEKFDTTYQTVYGIIKNKTWRHI